MATDNQTGVVAKTDNIHVRTGNTFKIQFGGQEVGLLQNMRLNDSYGLESASGIGDIHSIEYVPTKADHSISVSSMILNVKSLREAGVSLVNGDDALKGLIFEIVVMDKREPDKVLRKYTGVSFDSGDIEIGKHAIVSSNAQLKALDVLENRI